MVPPWKTLKFLMIHKMLMLSSQKRLLTNQNKGLTSQKNKSRYGVPVLDKSMNKLGRE